MRRYEINEIYSQILDKLTLRLVQGGRINQLIPQKDGGLHMQRTKGHVFAQITVQLRRTMFPQCLDAVLYWQIDALPTPVPHGLIRGALRCREFTCDAQSVLVLIDQAPMQTAGSAILDIG